MAGIRTCDRESQVQRPNHYTTEPPKVYVFENWMNVRHVFSRRLTECHYSVIHHPLYNNPWYNDSNPIIPNPNPNPSPNTDNPNTNPDPRPSRNPILNPISLTLIVRYSKFYSVKYTMMFSELALPRFEGTQMGPTSRERDGVAR